MTSPTQGALWGEAYQRARTARPFLKWAGGKSRFCHTYSSLLPAFSGKFLEPFLGGGAIFFHLARTQERPFASRLGDTNKHLIRAYADIRDRPKEVYERLAGLQAGYDAATNKATYYYEVRDIHNSRHPRTDTATFIFLNRTCWNGLWRVNERGRFNVPYGAPKSNAVIPSLNELLAASAALQGALVRATSWENTVALAEPGDFIFLDPPYYSELLQGHGGRKYHRELFDLKSHQRLAATLRSLADRDVGFVLTNSAEREMVELYNDHGFDTQIIEMSRNINSNAADRGKVPELVVTNVCQRERAVPSAAMLLDLEAHRLKTQRKVKATDRSEDSDED